MTCTYCGRDRSSPRIQLGSWTDFVRGLVELPAGDAWSLERERSHALRLRASRDREEHDATCPMQRVLAEATAAPALPAVSLASIGRAAIMLAVAATRAEGDGAGVNPLLVEWRRWLDLQPLAPLARAPEPKPGLAKALCDLERAVLPPLVVRELRRLLARVLELRDQGFELDDQGPAPGGPEIGGLHLEDDFVDWAIERLQTCFPLLQQPAEELGWHNRTGVDISDVENALRWAVEGPGALVGTGITRVVVSDLSEAFTTSVMFLPRPSPVLVVSPGFVRTMREKPDCEQVLDVVARHELGYGHLWQVRNATGPAEFWRNMLVDEQSVEGWAVLAETVGEDSPPYRRVRADMAARRLSPLVLRAFGAAEEDRRRELLRRRLFVEHAGQLMQFGSGYSRESYALGEWGWTRLLEMRGASADSIVPSPAWAHLSTLPLSCVEALCPPC